MKILIPGGSGHVGAVLIRHFLAQGHEVTVLSRHSFELPGVAVLTWDGETVGDWASTVDGTDVVVNLAGRSVNCRYHQANLDSMMNSRVRSVRAVGQAIAAAKNPPRVWLQASTATIYAHRYDAPNDEAIGILGGDEPGAPRTWNASIAIAKAWEAETLAIETPNTRKVLMRSAMTMSPDSGSVFDVLSHLTRLGLGGRLGNGRQYVSWIHQTDFARAVSFLIDRENLDGDVNLCSPNPLPQTEFASLLRAAWHVPFGLPAAEWMVEIGTWLRQTESELVLKSRRVIPTRLLEAGFTFEFPNWGPAAIDLASHIRNH
ncbi:MAG: TIGR01777 family oxidoreductase [Armatimonadetes bacterium]|nr:TIGR01777 family oxidoreductase [Armatimonadota bacterium]